MKKLLIPAIAAYLAASLASSPAHAHGEIIYLRKEIRDTVDKVEVRGPSQCFDMVTNALKQANIKFTEAELDAASDRCFQRSMCEISSSMTQDQSPKSIKAEFDKCLRGAEESPCRDAVLYEGEGYELPPEKAKAVFEKCMAERQKLQQPHGGEEQQPPARKN